MWTRSTWSVPSRARDPSTVPTISATGASAGRCPARGAELGGEEHLVAPAADALADRPLAGGVGVVGRSVEVADAALERLAHHVGARDLRRAEGDVRDVDAGAAETPVGRDPRAPPLAARRARSERRAREEDVARDGPPAMEARAFQAAAGDGSGAEPGGETQDVAASRVHAASLVAARSLGDSSLDRGAGGARPSLGSGRRRLPPGRGIEPRAQALRSGVHGARRARRFRGRSAPRPRSGGNSCRLRRHAAGVALVTGPRRQAPETGLSAVEFGRGRHARRIPRAPCGPRSRGALAHSRLDRPRSHPPGSERRNQLRLQRRCADLRLRSRQRRPERLPPGRPAPTTW